MKVFYEAPDRSPDEIQLEHRNYFVNTPVHSHNFYEIMLVSAGKALHYVNDSVEVVRHMQLSLIRPSDRHYYRDCYGSEFGYYNLHVPLGAWKRLTQNASADCTRLCAQTAPPLIAVPPREYLLLAQRLDRFHSLATGEPKRLLYDIILQEALYLLLALPQETPQSMPPWLNSLLIKMQNPAVFVKGLKRVLEISGYSQGYVNRSFRQYLDMTPTMYINHLRLDYAMSLIAEQGYTTLSASQSAGFNHYGYFASLFKRRYGCTPAEVKRA